MADKVIGLGVAALGLAILVLSVQLPQPVAATRIAYGPGFFPTILGAAVILAGIAILFEKPAENAEDVNVQSFSLHQLINPAIVFVAALAYVLFSQTLGFLVIAPLILFALLMLGNVARVPGIVIALVGSVIIYILFAKFLLVPLPLGLLAQWGSYL